MKVVDNKVCVVVFLMVIQGQGIKLGTTRSKESFSSIQDRNTTISNDKVHDQLTLKVQDTLHSRNNLKTDNQCNIAGTPETTLLRAFVDDFIKKESSFTLKPRDSDSYTSTNATKYHDASFESHITIIYFILLSILIVWKYIQTRKQNKESDDFKHPDKIADCLRAIYDAINVGVIATNNQMKITFINAAAAKMCGWNAGRAIGKPVNDVARVVKTDNNVQDTEVTTLQEDTLMLQSGDGRLIDVRQTITPLTVNNVVNGVIMILQDMTVSSEMMKKLSHSASHDALTGLANRTSFERRLHNAVNNSIEYSTQHSLVFLDLDGFKKVNDSCGHAAGDALLVQIARLMQCQLRCGDFLARLGGDEFGIILFDCGLDQAKSLVENLVKKIKDHVFYWNGKSEKVGASAGLTEITEETRCIGQLLGKADAACYTAKSRGKGQALVFDKNSLCADSKSKFKF